MIIHVVSSPSDSSIFLTTNFAHVQTMIAKALELEVAVEMNAWDTDKNEICQVNLDFDFADDPTLS